MHTLRWFRKISVFVFCMLVLSGCAVHEYKGHNFPPLSSFAFPSFEPVNEITEEIQIKIPEGRGRSVTIMEIAASSNGKKINISSNYEMKWDVGFKDKKIYTYCDVKEVTSTPDGKESTNIILDAIHDMSGNEILVKIKVDGKDVDRSVLDSDAAERLIKMVTNNIRYQLASLGYKVKTGDILKYTDTGMGEFGGLKRKGKTDKIPEVVRGWGVYNNKKVIVTEYVWEYKIEESGVIAEIRLKGYNLYDAESFVQLNSNAVGYMAIFNPYEGTINLKFVIELRNYDIQVNKIAVSPTEFKQYPPKPITPTRALIERVTPSQPTVKKTTQKKKAGSPKVKSSKKSKQTTQSWEEASEKLKALGDLLEKGLITQEEYDAKKKVLLESF